jgi:hypothetical protein
MTSLTCVKPPSLRKLYVLGYTAPADNTSAVSFRARIEQHLHALLLVMEMLTCKTASIVKSKTMPCGSPGHGAVLFFPHLDL